MKLLVDDIKSNISKKNKINKSQKMQYCKFTSAS